MKKFLVLSLLSWLMFTGHAMADEFIINDITVPQGGSADLAVGFNFTSTTNKVGFTLSIGLPEGLSFEKDDDGDIKYEKDETSAGKLNIQQVDEGNIAGLPSTETATIKGTSGTLLTLHVAADASLEVGSSYVVSVTNATFQQKVDGTLSDISVDDFTFTITIGEAEDGRVKFNETSTSLPSYTAGETYDVTMTRTVKAGNWNTIVFPFNLTKANANKIFGTDVKFAKFSGFEVDYGDDEENVTPLQITVRFTSYTIPARGGKLEGGTPVLVMTNNDVTEPFELDGVTLTDVVKEESAADEYGTQGKFVGSFVKTVVPRDGLFIAENKFWYSTGQTNIKAFRGWFELGAVLDKETTDWGGAKISFFVDDMPASIDGIGMNDNQELKGSVYTVGGQLVGTDVKMNQLKKGVYIKDGK